jgi:hypothetical protein
MKRTLAVVTLGATALAVGGVVAIGTAQAQQAKSFPTVYKLNEGVPTGGTNGLLTLTGTMRAADGTHGTLKNTFREKRTARGTVRCGGKTYHGPFTENLKNPGGYTFHIVGWGIASAKTTRTIAVFRQAGVGSSPPICAADTGTYHFTSGQLKGKHGTFTTLATNLLTAKAKDTLNFH